MDPHRALLATLLGAALAVAACGGSGASAAPTPGAMATGAPGQVGSGTGSGGVLGGSVTRGGDYCGLLGPGDFAGAGVAGAGAPTANPDPQGAYCVYAGKSGATGGIELDVFVANDAAEAESIYPNVRSFLDDGTGKAALPGADEAAIMPRDPVYAAIAVRKGLLVFGISFSEGDGSRDRLVQLAKLVLERGDALTH